MIRRFNRFELKYIIPVQVRDAVRRDLELNMQPDVHGDADGSYRVTSLYYDTPNLDCFRAKVEGIKYRRKLRARIYGEHGDDPDVMTMVEIKQRINRTVQKRRVAVPLARAYALCAGVGDGAEVWDDPDDALVGSEVEFLVRSLRLEPVCVISYLRQAFVGSRYEPGLRITFDQVLGCRGPEALLGSGTPTRLFMDPGWLVMEVKVNDAVPLWVARTLSRHQCSLRRISKYCTGLACLRSLARPVEHPRSEEWMSF
ncbi:MAG: polyphosphate polymerase domain-containing protein [Myxococcota bacterium]